MYRAVTIAGLSVEFPSFGLVSVVIAGGQRLIQVRMRRVLGPSASAPSPE